ncbi:hypothetical protein CNE_1c11960 [Cupriavidus necator N-1]|uniref:Phage tail protein n=1 Tax=Cupriavidus necator (strain ATCC 43291 / DSM 13513 / CCUG 52238 / LMG 8453 / N-1) TaxID=1042878 RepID=G0ER33_CUPNN|nr:phage tail tube protein [Cupriavidus necator]AEI76551.1 hypothetical protein CNE_1c11960 [Cupriavidus necator N-1]MDX6011326.1 phage tail tube protein [Cupriavidus necator]
MAGKQVMGRAFITVAGQRLASVPGSAKLNTGGVERTPQVSDAGTVFYTEKPVQSEIECDILITADTDIIALNSTTDAVVLFQADSGQSYMVRNGAMASPLNPQAGDGKASVKMFGAPAEAV